MPEENKLKIDESNFKDYFFPVKDDYKPEKGQVLSRWRAAADFVDGWMKRNVIEMLCSQKNGAETSLRVMQKLVCATERDAIKVLREMADDLVKGATVDEVAEKPYRMVVEQFYWTRKEYIPDDPHWEYIHTVDVRDKQMEFKIVSGLDQVIDSDNI